MFDLLSLLRKEKRVTGAISQAHGLMLPPILNAIVMKSRYDEERTWGCEDEDTDEAEFRDLRKRLKTLQETVAAIDEDLYINSLSNLVGGTLERVAKNGVGSIDWREVDLAMYEMFLFGELTMRNGGIFTKGKPQGPASETLIGMMMKMMDSGRSP